ncbi:MAG: hypothetical protein IJ033_02030 [Clostridia bacterium]|nr:hypothetical protein [Clostridia bacterium]
MVPVAAGVISGILKGLFKIIIGICKIFSLAILYAIVGVVLYAIWGFNPFDGSLYAILYLVGFGFSVLLSLLLAFRDKGKKSKKTEPTWRWGKKMEEDEPKKGFFETLKEKKRLKAERQKEEREEQERLLREEELRAQERRLEELRAERLREEIAREERLIDEYRHEAANHALHRYEEVVSAHPLPTEPAKSRYDEINYFSGDWGQSVEQKPAIKNAYATPVSPLRRETPVSPKFDETNYFSALNNPYMETKPSYEQPTVESYPYGYGAKKQAEEPKIYLSAIEPNTLIHEYSDRFEVYDLNGGEKTLKTIVNKGE